MIAEAIKNGRSVRPYPAFRCLADVGSCEDALSFGCGIALACGRFVPGQTSDQDRWEGIRTAALSTELVLELLSWDAACPHAGWHQERRQEFMNWLGLHPDARLRAAAAAEPTIVPSLVRQLAADPAYAVRCALSQNACAVSAMKSDLAVRFASEDAEIAENAMHSMLEALEQRMLECDEVKGRRPRSVEEFNRIHQLPEEVEKLRRKVRELARVFAEHEDPNVKQCARETADRLHFLCESVDKGLVRRPGRKTSWTSAAFDCGLDDCVYALVYLEIDEESGETVADCKIAAVPISLGALQAAASQLPVGRKTDDVVLRLAGHGADVVRAAVASRAALPFQAIERLKKDKTYAVRRALLNNESLLAEFSEKDILEMLGEDPGLVEDAFGWGSTSPRIGAMLKKRFAGSPDPHLREIVSKLED